jgi:hypothetical protein
LGKDVYILTSKRTFSAAEEFTYNLQGLKRATVIGETTGGGAHPGRGYRINDHFMMFVPTGRAINPVTKTNWEGTGVKPDVEVPAEKALETAHRTAQQKLQDKNGNAATRVEPGRGPEQGKKEPTPALPGAGPRQPLRFGLTLLMLLKQKSVQDELKLTSAQVKEVEAAAEKEMRAFNDLFSLPPEEHAKRLKELTKENDQKAVRTLSPGQEKRLRQIRLQVQGPRVFTDPQLAQELNLTEEQRQRVGKMVEEFDQQMGKSIQPGVSPEEARQKMRARDKDARERLLKLLTPEQQAKWKEMAGEPFDGPIGINPPGVRRVRVAP